MARRKKKFNLTEYSKKLVTVITTLWVIGALYGFFVCTVQLIRMEPVSLYDLFTYIGAPMVAVGASYLFKSAFENKEKIKNNNDAGQDVDVP